MKFADEEELKEFLEETDQVLFYGVGGMGRNLYFYLKRYGWEKKLPFFIVTEKNVDTFQGIPVKAVGKLGESEQSIPVIIATRKNFHKEIRAELTRAGVEKVYTAGEELLTRLEYLANQFCETDIEKRSLERCNAWKKRKQEVRRIWEEAGA